MPAFNHTRADGPFDPCPLCLEVLSRDALLALAKDQRYRIDHALARVAELHEQIEILKRDVRELLLRGY